MERYSYEISSRITKKYETLIIALKKSQLFLPLFFPYAIIKAVLNKKKEKTVVHISDALLSPVGIIIKKLTGFPVILTVHGLDVTFPNYLYQKIIPFFMKKYDKIVCVSNETLKECVKRGLSEEKCVVIPNGINIKKKDKTDKKILKEILKNKLEKGPIILSVGRLTKRKGFHWFLSETVPKLVKKEKNLCYLIVGKGKMQKQINAIIKTKRLEKNVFSLGEVKDDVLENLFSCSDLFVMPNIKVEGDVEGFGIVAIEAASYGLPVVASDLEGIKDAVKEGKNGILVEPENSSEYYETIIKLLNNREKREKIGKNAKQYTEKNYDWNNIITKYEKIYNNLIGE